MNIDIAFSYVEIERSTNIIALVEHHESSYQDSVSHAVGFSMDYTRPVLATVDDITQSVAVSFSYISNVLIEAEDTISKKLSVTVAGGDVLVEAEDTISKKLSVTVAVGSVLEEVEDTISKKLSVTVEIKDADSTSAQDTINKETAIDVSFIRHYNPLISRGHRAYFVAPDGDGINARVAGLFNDMVIWSFDIHNEGGLYTDVIERSFNISAIPGIPATVSEETILKQFHVKARSKYEDSAERLDEIQTRFVLNVFTKHNETEQTQQDIINKQLGVYAFALAGTVPETTETIGRTFGIDSVNGHDHSFMRTEVINKELTLSILYDGRVPEAIVENISKLFDINTPAIQDYNMLQVYDEVVKRLGVLAKSKHVELTDIDHDQLSRSFSILALPGLNTTYTEVIEKHISTVLLMHNKDSQITNNEITRTFDMNIYVGYDQSVSKEETINKQISLNLLHDGKVPEAIIEQIHKQHDVTIEIIDIETQSIDEISKTISFIVIETKDSDVDIQLDIINKQSVLNILYDGKVSNSIIDDITKTTGIIFSKSEQVLLVDELIKTFGTIANVVDINTELFSDTIGKTFGVDYVYGNDHSFMRAENIHKQNNFNIIYDGKVFLHEEVLNNKLVDISLVVKDAEAVYVQTLTKNISVNLYINAIVDLQSSVLDTLNKNVSVNITFNGKLTTAEVDQINHNMQVELRYHNKNTQTVVDVINKTNDIQLERTLYTPNLVDTIARNNNLIAVIGDNKTISPDTVDNINRAHNLIINYDGKAAHHTETITNKVVEVLTKVIDKTLTTSDSSLTKSNAIVLVTKNEHALAHIDTLSKSVNTVQKVFNKTVSKEETINSVFGIDYVYGNDHSFMRTEDIVKNIAAYAYISIQSTGYYTDTLVKTMGTVSIIGDNKLTVAQTDVLNKSFNVWATYFFPDKVAEPDVNTINKTVDVLTSQVNPITITLNKQSGSGGTSSITSVYGFYLNPTSSITIPTRNGYTFAGYYTGTDGSGTLRINSSGTYVSLSNTTYSTAATLYARWTLNTYNITVNLNGGSGASNSTYNINTSNTLTNLLGTPSRTGYTFTGWKVTSSSAGGWTNGTTYAASTNVSGKYAHVTLQAQWSANTYTITLDKQSGSGGTSSITSVYATSLNPTTVSVPTRTGYTFSGYYTSTGGGGTLRINSSGTYTALTNTTYTSNTTLYAYWVPTVYTLTKGSIPTGVSTFVITRNTSPIGGGSIGALNSGASIYYNDTLTVTASAQNGYNTPTTSHTNVTVTGNTNITVTAGSVISYTITVALNGGTGVTNKNYTIVTTGTLGALLGTPTRTNYNLKGWKVTSASTGGWTNGTTYSVASTLAGKYGNVTLEAQWALVHADTVATDNTISKNIATLTTQVNPITITLNQQSGSGGTSSITSVYGFYLSPTSITVPSRTGYSFGGYYTGTNGSGTLRISSSGTYTNLTNTTYSSNVTLYARWVPKTYTITLNKQSGSGGTSSIAGVYGSSLSPLSIAVPTRSGYTFLGYYTSTSGGTQRINASGTYVALTNTTYSSNVTLYARWTERVIGETTYFKLSAIDYIVRTKSNVPAGAKITVWYKGFGWGKRFTNTQGNSNYLRSSHVKIGSTHYYPYGFHPNTHYVNGTVSGSIFGTQSTVPYDYLYQGINKVPYKVVGPSQAITNDLRNKTPTGGNYNGHGSSSPANPMRKHHFMIALHSSSGTILEYVFLQVGTVMVGDDRMYLTVLEKTPQFQDTSLGWSRP